MTDNDMVSNPTIRKHISKFEEIVFTANGEILTTKDSYVSCIIVVTTSIIYIFKIKFAGKITLKYRLSIHDLTGIRYMSTLARVLTADVMILTVQSEKIKEFEQAIISVFNKFNYASNCPLTIDFDDYPKDKPKLGSISQRPEHLSLYRYHTLITRYMMPSHSDHKNIYLFYEATNKTSITFDNDIVEPEYYDIISIPVSHESNLRYINFNGFAPNTINFMLRDIIMKSKSITTITLRNYQELLKPDIIEFAKNSDPSIVSWTFENCFENGAEFLQFFGQFSTYQGVIQSLTIRNIQLTAGITRAFCEYLKNSRCFINLESLVIENVSTSVEINGIDLYNTIDNACKNLAKLTHLSVCGWSTTVTHRKVALGVPYLITQCQTLRHLCISHQSFMEMDGFLQLPPGLVQLDCGFCIFSCTSLMSLIRSIKEHGKRLSVNLSTLQMKTVDWQGFYRDSIALKGIDNIVELNFSGNKFAPEFEKTFCEIFVSPTLKFIDLSNIFTADDASLAQLYYIIKQLEKIDLYGFAIEGGEQAKIGDKITDVIFALRNMKSMEYLDVAYHNVSDSATLNLHKHLELLKMLHEIKMDGTENLGKHNFLGFYKKLFQPLNINSIWFPLADYKRLYSKLDAIVSDFGSDKCQAWWEVVFAKNLISTPFIRAEFYRRNKPFTEFQDFLATFPIPLWGEKIDTHYFHHNWHSTNSDQRSLYDEEFLSCDKFVTRQTASMTSPFSPPKFEGPSEITIPVIMRRYFGTEQFNVQRKIVEVKHSEEIREEFVHSHMNMINKDTASMIVDVDRLTDMLAQLADEETDLECNIPAEKPAEVINPAELEFFKKELRALHTENLMDPNETMGPRFVIANNQMAQQAKKVVSVKYLTQKSMKKSVSLALNEDYVLLLKKIREDKCIQKDCEEETLANLKAISNVETKMLHEEYREGELNLPPAYPVAPYMLDAQISGAINGNKLPKQSDDLFDQSDDEEIDLKFFHSEDNLRGRTLENFKSSKIVPNKSVLSRDPNSETNFYHAEQQPKQNSNENKPTVKFAPQPNIAKNGLDDDGFKMPALPTPPPQQPQQQQDASYFMPPPLSTQIQKPEPPQQLPQNNNLGSLAIPIVSVGKKPENPPPQVNSLNLNAPPPAPIIIPMQDEPQQSAPPQAPTIFIPPALNSTLGPMAVPPPAPPVVEAKKKKEEDYSSYSYYSDDEDDKKPKVPPPLKTEINSPDRNISLPQIPVITPLPAQPTPPPVINTGLKNDMDTNIQLPSIPIPVIATPPPQQKEPEVPVISTPPLSTMMPTGMGTPVIPVVPPPANAPKEDKKKNDDDEYYSDSDYYYYSDDDDKPKKDKKQSSPVVTPPVIPQQPPQLPRIQAPQVPQIPHVQAPSIPAVPGGFQPPVITPPPKISPPTTPPVFTPPIITPPVVPPQ